ncbi:MAG: DUF1127 domain-containing protein [Alphaproteobacteria bacterium]
MPFSTMMKIFQIGWKKAQAWGRAWRRLENALERWQQRRFLRTLNERTLKDLGLSRCDVEREANKRWRR